MKILPVLLCLAAVLPFLPIALAGSGGGTVSNVVPAVQTFVGDQATVNNNNAVQENFTMTVFDANGEPDLQSVQITSTSSAFATATWSGIACASPPASWSCTDSTPNDGKLTITYHFTWPAATATGTFTQTPFVKDATPYVSGAADTTTIAASAVLNFAANQVYDATGTAVAQNWGGWTASPGAANVNAGNYLKSVNTGTAAGTSSVSFQQGNFTGPSNATITIASNIKFCTAQTSDSSPQAPNALTFSCDATSSVDGSRSFSIPSHATVWITYQLAALPAILSGGSYTASYSGA